METNLARLAESALQRLGDHPSLYYEGTWYSSGELHERAKRLATGLRGLGVQPGDRVVVFMANCPEVGIMYSALWRAGAVVTPVIFLISPPELRHILDDSGAVAVITSPELKAAVEAALDGRPLPVIVVGENYAELEDNEPSPIVDRSGDDLAALLYTGGTTGRSKGVCLTHTNLSSAGASSRKNSYVPGVNRGISGLPLSHSFGLLVTVGGLHAPEPGSAVLLRWFDAATWLRLASEQRSQSAAMVPSMLAMLLAQPLEEYDLSELRFVFSGAAPLAPAIRADFMRRAPGVTVLEGYGCTETAGLISGTPPLAPRPGTVGRPVADVEVRIEAPDGSEAPVGEDGEIVVRGPNIMARYWGADEPQGEWFHTGDIGHLDAEGYLSIVDRIKDLIIRGGYNVYPRDVEDALLTHPQVAMAAVVGRPDYRLGEEVVAFVSLVAGATVTAEELIAYSREQLAANKYPRDVHIVDAIPLTSVGKLDRKKLRAAVKETIPVQPAAPVQESESAPATA
jgi:long-chain acyl-CoA synthetase